MSVKATLEAVHGGCLNYTVRYIIPSVDNSVAKHICANIQS